MSLAVKFSDSFIEAGCDEAGRGCLAGPVVAAAVILPLRWDNPMLNDSKKLSEKKRFELREIILHEVQTYGIGIVSAKEIDEINILNASFLAMHRAIDQLKTKPELLLIDGNRFNAYKNIPHQCIIGGDAKFQSIAAASILAKTTRDMLMQSLHKEHPVYKWDKNKGYPTREHRDAIAKVGLSPLHRLSFNHGVQLKIVF
ncbi:MAG: ribonuclease HII [Lentimicrobiaceae bacterium]|jgi:ribonuclease HII|nr:ribonuclease HII [Lentimicrobiaceae bacterium]